MARKSKYETHVLPNLEQIRKWTEDGAPLDEIARHLSLAPSTLRLYLQKAQQGEQRYSAFSEAIACARKAADEEIENALFRLAKGYTVALKKTFKLRRVEYDKKTGKKIGEYEELVEGVDEVNVPANVQAQMFWLANRQPQRWKYKPGEGDTDGAEDGGVVIVPGENIHAEE